MPYFWGQMSASHSNPGKWWLLFLFNCAFLAQGLSAQPAGDPEFYSRFSNLLPEYRWVSMPAVQQEAQEIWEQSLHESGPWAVSAPRMQRFLGSLTSAQLPPTFVYLPAALEISQGMRPADENRRGLWQQHYLVAARYGLKVNPWVDERLDPEQSAAAALRQLAEMTREFNDPGLAVLAFLSSPATLRKALTRSRASEEGISLLQALDAATVRVYHRFLATVYLQKYRAAADKAGATKGMVGGGTPKTGMGSAGPADLVTATVNPSTLAFVNPLACTRTAVIATNHLDSAEFQIRNPHLLGNLIPRGVHLYSDPNTPLRAVSPQSHPDSGYQYMVCTTDSLRSYLNKLNQNPEPWLQLNALTGTHAQVPVCILLPRPADTIPTLVATLAIGSTPIPDAATKAGPRPATAVRYYTVRSGDSLWTIAKKYPGVTAADIQRANRLKNPDSLQPKQKLKIPQG